MNHTFCSHAICCGDDFENGRFDAAVLPRCDLSYIHYEGSTSDLEGSRGWPPARPSTPLLFGFPIVILHDLARETRDSKVSREGSLLTCGKLFMFFNCPNLATGAAIINLAIASWRHCFEIDFFYNPAKGRYLYDVRTEGVGGLGQKKMKLGRLRGFCNIYMNLMRTGGVHKSRKFCI